MLLSLYGDEVFLYSRIIYCIILVIYNYLWQLYKVLIVLYDLCMDVIM